MNNTLGNLTAAAMAALLLAGCASPQAVAPQATPLDAAQLLPGQAAAHTLRQDWWQALDDARLTALVERALAANPDLTLATARLRKASAGVAGAAATGGLQVDASLDSGRDRFSPYDSVSPAPIGGHWYDRNRLGLNLEYSLDFWGKERSRVAAAAGQQRAAQLESQDARQWVASAVVAQYLELAAAQQALTLARQDVELARALQQQVEGRLRAGLGQPDEQDQSRASLAESRARQERAALRVTQARHALAALCGDGPDTTVALDARLPAWTLDTQSLSLAILASRPDVAASLARVDAARSGVDAARAEFYPDVRLSALVGLSAQDLGDLFTRQARLISTAFAFTLPIFHSGALNANLDAHTADYDAAVAVYNRTLLAAARDGADRVAALGSAQRTHRELTTQLQAKALAARRSAQRYQAGLSGRTQQLAAERERVDAAIKDNEARAQALQAQVALIRALGGAPA